MTTKSNSNSNSDPATRDGSVAFVDAFWFWLKLGFISFGGPAGQISVMHQELVERRRWISERRFLHALNYTMVLPGPEAQQLATYLGWLMHGTWGGLVAGSLFVLPSFFIITGLAWVYLAYGELPVVAGILFGIKPAVTAIVLFAAYRIGSRALSNVVLWSIAAAAFIAIFALNVPFPYIVVGAGVIGFFGGRFAPEQFAAKGHENAEGNSGEHVGAVIDDDTPLPAHARYRPSRLIRYIAVGLLIWLGTMALLTTQFGIEGALTQMGWFFTKAALVTFGGAYAVLPYVFQGGVEHYQWLSATQMIDGLALGETTPGPLIMIVTFVGFVGGWTQTVFGEGALLTSAMAGAAVATVFTFLPSFLFILVGAPAVEATRDNLSFTAPLSGITAAVVGVIINLALFFAYHVLWPEGFDGPMAWWAVPIGLAAFIALIRYRVGIIPVVAASGAVGLVLGLTGLV